MVSVKSDLRALAVIRLSLGLVIFGTSVVTATEGKNDLWNVDLL